MRLANFAWFWPMQQAAAAFEAGDGGRPYLIASRTEMPVNILSSRSVAAAVRHWYCRMRMLAVVKVYSGSDRAGRWAFASGWTGIGKREADAFSGDRGPKPSAAAQASIQPTQVSAMLSTGNQSYVATGGYSTAQLIGLGRTDDIWADINAYNELDREHKFRDEGGQVKFNVGLVVLRWSQRRFFWDEGSGQRRVRDLARIQWEQLSIANFTADLLVVDKAYDPGCPPLIVGFEGSHCCESYHNPTDWPTLEFNFFEGSRLGTPQQDARHRQQFAVWRGGKKVELLESETADCNESRQACTRYQLHWTECDASSVAIALDQRRQPQPLEMQPDRIVRMRRPNPSGGDAFVLRPFSRENGIRSEPFELTEVRLPEGWPTCCPHSVVGTPCYGPPAVALRTITGASVQRKRQVASGGGGGPGDVFPAIPE